MRMHASVLISIAALTVAIFGSTPIGEAAWEQVVPRNSVGPKQLMRNAVKARHVAPNAVRSAHVLNGALLAADFKAGQLPQGPKGEKGDKGDVGVSGYQIVNSNTANDSTSVKADSALCPPGKRVIGGGALTIGGVASVALVSSIANPGGGSWLAQAVEVNSFTGSWTLIVRAICATVAS